MNVLKNIFAFLLGLLVFFVSDAIFTSLLNILFSLILAIPFASTVLSFPSSPTFYATTGVVTASSVLTLKITTWVISKIATENKCEKNMVGMLLGIVIMILSVSLTIASLILKTFTWQLLVGNIGRLVVGFVILLIPEKPDEYEDCLV